MSMLRSASRQLDCPVFCFLRDTGEILHALEWKIYELLHTVVESMGFELVAVELSGAGKQTILRLYIDAGQGVTVDDCADVSYQVSGVLDVEDPLHGRYTLEVSSPGLDRPLAKPEHFHQYVGSQVRVRSTEPVLGRRKFRGKLESFDGENLVIAVDNEAYEIPLQIVDKANLVPEFDD